MLKILNNGETHIITGDDEEDIRNQIEELEAQLEADTVEWEIIRLQPAVIIIVTQGAATYTEVLEPGDEGWVENGQEIPQGLAGAVGTERIDDCCNSPTEFEAQLALDDSDVV